MPYVVCVVLLFSIQHRKLFSTLIKKQKPICFCHYTMMIFFINMHSFSDTTIVVAAAHYVWFSWFWSHFFLHYVYSGSCTITSKAKINVFWKFFFTPLAPSGPLRSKKFQKTLILAFEANSALSRENETKIVKITHST